MVHHIKVIYEDKVFKKLLKLKNYYKCTWGELFKALAFIK